jgi:hypothetical protein
MATTNIPKDFGEEPKKKTGKEPHEETVRASSHEEDVKAGEETKNKLFGTPQPQPGEHQAEHEGEGEHNIKLSVPKGAGSGTKLAEPGPSGSQDPAQQTGERGLEGKQATQGFPKDPHFLNPGSRVDKDPK